MALRAPVIDDAPAVFELLKARDIADLGIPDCTLEDVRDDWNATELSLSTDVRVVQEGGLVVGYGIVRSPGAFAAVRPDSEGKGVGSRLLRWTERRERELGRPQHRQLIAATNDRARALLQAAGYERARSYYRMVRALDEVAPAGATPAGVTVRPLEPDADAERLHALDAAAFADIPDYEPISLIAFREDHLRAHDIDPELSCVAQRGRSIAGFLLTRLWAEERVGYVSILAVRPGEQGRGIGTTMLRHAFERFAAAGLNEAQLGVSSENAGALGLYERVGMSPRFRFDAYERPISG
jgi:mycothiol synthase